MEHHKKTALFFIFILIMMPISFGGVLGGQGVTISPTSVGPPAPPGYENMLINGRIAVVEKMPAATDAVAKEGADAAKGGWKWPAEWAPQGTFFDGVFTGAQYAGFAYLAGQLIGGLTGMSEGQTDALSYGLAAGAGVFGAAQGGTEGAIKFLETGGFQDGIFTGWGWAAIGAGLIVFAMEYEDVEYETETLSYQCNPWEAPDGGEFCEVCNADDLPCSEYRCKSLGKSCEIVNEGSEEERCVAVNPRDITPPTIKPNEDLITEDHEYTDLRSSPASTGTNIIYQKSNDGCLKAFTPLEFGIISEDEPAQCKIALEKDTPYEDMYFLGASSLYKYNHTERFALPGIANLEQEGITLPNGGDFTFYITCKDYNGNMNKAPYALRLCVDDTPDTTPPKVLATSIEDESCIAHNEESSPLSVYLNEPAQCRWSFTDKDYDNMENEMTCATGITSITPINGLNTYQCLTELNGVAYDGTDYFIRCKDQPLAGNENDRNEMTSSFDFKLRGSDELRIDFIKPNATVYGSIDPTPVELYVETSYGCDSGKAVCMYSDSGEEGDYIRFSDTNNDDGIHTQRLDFSDGNQKQYIQCIDGGGNSALSVLNFKVDIQTDAPSIARIYEEGGLLKVVTIRDSECSYTTEDCNFMFDEGLIMPPANSISHAIEWNEEETYYIKCRDEFKSEGASCSVIVKPTDNFLN